MPLYEYRAVEPEKGCDHCRTSFEVLQSVNAPPVEQCPECGAPCQRLFSAFAPVKSTKDMLSSKNLSRCGLTQYKKAGDGFYEKTAGDGPSVINRDGKEM